MASTALLAPVWHDRACFAIYRMITNELLAAFLIVFLTSLTLTNMIYVATGIRNLSLVALFVLAGLPIFHNKTPTKRLVSLSKIVSLLALQLMRCNEKDAL